MTRKAKRYLMLLAAIGLVAVVVGGGSGTFAGFNAQITNNGNYIATGTLFLHQKAGTGNICKSEGVADNNTSNVIDCGALFTDGSPAVEDIAMTNGGSINASSFNLTAATCLSSRPVVAQAATYGPITIGTPTTLSLTGMTQTLVAGTDLIVGSDTFTVDAPTVPPSGEAATINVTPTTAEASPVTGPVDVQLAAFGGENFCTSDVQVTIQSATDSNYTVTPDTACVYPATITCTTTPGTLSGLHTASPLSFGGLTAGQTKYYVVTISIPSGSNALQNNKAKFDLAWQIAQ
jgi:hypothetical protein